MDNPEDSEQFKEKEGRLISFSSQFRRGHADTTRGVQRTRGDLRGHFSDGGGL
jgi:hypothetical protein